MYGTDAGNSLASTVKRLKGEGRPMQDVHARAEMLASKRSIWSWCSVRTRLSNWSAACVPRCCSEVVTSVGRKVEATTA